MQQRKPELKHKDTTLIASAITDSWKFQLLNGISEGTTDSDRIGQVIRMQKIQLKLHVEKTSVYNRNTLVRLAIVYDTGAEGATFDTADVFNVDDSADSFLRLPFNSRYKVLWDKIFALNQIDGTYDAGGANLVSTNRLRWMPKV